MLIINIYIALSFETTQIAIKTVLDWFAFPPIDTLSDPPPKFQNPSLQK